MKFTFRQLIPPGLLVLLTGVAVAAADRYQTSFEARMSTMEWLEEDLKQSRPVLAYWAIAFAVAVWALNRLKPAGYGRAEKIAMSGILLSGWVIATAAAGARVGQLPMWRINVGLAWPIVSLSLGVLLRRRRGNGQKKLVSAE